MPLPPFPPDRNPAAADARPAREPSRWVPQLPRSERDRRWERLRRKMLLAGIDALVLFGNDIYWGMGMANMRYLFQVESYLGGFAIFPLSGDPVVWNNVPHMNRPFNMYHALYDWIGDLRTYAGIPAVAAELHERGLSRTRLGLVGFSSTIQTTPTLLHKDVVDLEAALPHATFVDAGPLIEEMRIVKSEAEIALLRGAGKIARKVIDAMVTTARPGVPEAVVYAEMIRTQIANGGEPNVFNLFASGPVEHPPSELWHLLHGCEQPLVPTMRPLADGDIIVAEWHTKYGGYRCHTEYTVYLGKRVPDQLQRIWDVSLECLEASKTALTAGRTIGEAVRMIREPALRAGLDWVELGFHAMGLASPEFPTVIYADGYGHPALNGDRIGDMVLEEGMAFGNNIDLHDSRWKPDVGCMLSDFMIVRPGKAECLIGTPTEIGVSG